jgi:two-component system response regulator DesR
MDQHGGARLRTLVVDDDEDMRVLIRTTIAIADRGLEVACEAADGLEALAVWEACRPDVVVLDQRMPGLNGLEAAARILARRPDQPIVLFSAFLTPAVRRSAAEVGIRACLAKDEVHRLPETLWGLAA